MSCARHPEQERASVQSDGLSVLLHRPSPYAGAHRGGEWAGGAVARPVHSQGDSSSGDGVWSNNHTKEKKSMSVHSRGGRPVVPVRRRNPLSSSDRISESARPPARSSALARTRKESRNPSDNLDCSVRTWTTPLHRDLNSLYLLPRHHVSGSGVAVAGSSSPPVRFRQGSLEIFLFFVDIMPQWFLLCHSVSPRTPQLGIHCILGALRSRLDVIFLFVRSPLGFSSVPGPNQSKNEKGEMEI